jgi:ABC-type transport system substrate-binding protein
MSTVDKVLVSTYADETAEFSALKSNLLDLTDWTLSSTDLPSTCTPGSTAILCDSRFYVTASVANTGMFGIDFNYGNTYFGINFGFGRDSNPQAAAATHFRQAVAHLISKGDFISKVLNGLGQAMDNPLPPGQGAMESGAPCNNPPPAPATCTSNYSVPGYPNISGVCGTGAGTTNQGWDSLDAQFRAAGQTCNSVYAFHYGTDTTDSAGVVNVGQPDFCDAADHFIAAGLATGKSATDCTLTGVSAALSGGSIAFVVRRDNAPRLAVGNALAQRLCQLINGATVTSCTQIVVNHLSIQETRPIVFATDHLHLEWWMYTQGWGLGTTYEQVWSLYNHAFAPPCGGTPGPVDTNYVSFCNDRFDHFNQMIEFNDTATGASASLQIADNIAGNHTMTIEIYALGVQFAYLKGWKGVNNAAGIGPPNANTLFNMWSPTPAVNGTIRWGFKQGTNDVNTLSYATQWEGYVVQSVYDTLLASNPYSPNDLYCWMCTSFAKSAPAPTDPPGTAVDYKFQLRQDIKFHDGQPVTANDFVFSWLAFNATGGLVNPLVQGIVGVKVDNAFSFTVNLNSNSVFALFNLGGVWMLPQHVWATDTSHPCTGSSILSQTANVFGSAAHTAQCSLNPALFSTTTNVDPVATDRYIGSGPWVCFDTVGNVPGGKCTSSGTGNVPFGGTIVLQRMGLGISGASPNAYFRDAAKYKTFQWADFTKAGIVTPADKSILSACLNKVDATPIPGTTQTCGYWDSPASVVTCPTPQAGSCFRSGGLLVVPGGNNSGSTTTTDLNQLAAFLNVQWTSPIAYGSLVGAVASPQTLYEGGIVYG